jgi:hypothetical protein
MKYIPESHLWLHAGRAARSALRSLCRCAHPMASEQMSAMRHSTSSEIEMGTHGFTGEDFPAFHHTVPFIAAKNTSRAPLCKGADQDLYVSIQATISGG